MLFEQARLVRRACCFFPRACLVSGALSRVGSRWNKSQCAPRVSRSTSTACRTAARRRAPSRQEPTSPPRAPERGGRGRRCVRGLRSSLGARVSGQDFPARQSHGGRSAAVPRRCTHSQHLNRKGGGERRGRGRGQLPVPFAPTEQRTKGYHEGYGAAPFCCPGTSVSVRMAVPIVITSGPA